MNSVEKVKSLCKERKIPISRLEKDLGFSNGYIGQLRKGVFPDDRLVQIAEYLSVSVEYLISGVDPKNEKTPTLTKKDERKTEDDIVKFALFKGDGEVTDAMLDEVKAFAAFVLQREKQKKETK